jgi:glucan phosphoethanolaminetransferase (alkaline phosphatase superfamily)
MEFDENDDQPYNEDDYVEIYSKKAIFWFSVFSPLFAGILLIINLWVAGFKSAVYQVVAFIMAWALATYFVENEIATVLHINLNKPATTLDLNMLYLNLDSIAMNVLCGFILTRFFFKKYFPDDDYYPRSIQMPLFIFIGFILFFMLIIGRSF